MTPDPNQNANADARKVERVKTLWFRQTEHGKQECEFSCITLLMDISFYWKDQL